MPRDLVAKCVFFGLLSTGISGRFVSEWVDDLARNTHTLEVHREVSRIFARVR